MTENLRNNDGSSVYARIEATPMAESDRQSALAALEMAERLVDGVMWVWARVVEPVNQLFLKPRAKH